MREGSLYIFNNVTKNLKINSHSNVNFFNRREFHIHRYSTKYVIWPSERWNITTALPFCLGKLVLIFLIKSSNFSPLSTQVHTALSSTRLSMDSSSSSRQPNVSLLFSSPLILEIYTRSRRDRENIEESRRGGGGAGHSVGITRACPHC